MIRHLPQLLLTQRLSSITSVEMMWTIYPSRYGHDLPTPLDVVGLPAIYSSMNVLESAMPHLTRLSITLDCDLTLEHWVEDNSQDERKPTISTPIDDMVRRMRPGLKDCNITIAFHVFEKRRRRVGPMKDMWDLTRELEDSRYWRELPCTDIGNEAPAIDLGGYWVSCGKFDERFSSGAYIQ